MLLTLCLTLFTTATISAAPPVALAAVAPAAAVVRGDDKPDKRPEVKAALAELKAHVKKKAKEDEEAIAVLDLLVGEYAESGPKDQKAIADGVAKCLSAKRPKELEPGVPDDRLYLASAVCLGRMGPHSVKPLTSALNAKSFKNNLVVRRELALALGKTKDPKGVKPLIELLKNHHAEMQAAGADGLVNFTEIALKTRKDIVNELIKIMMGQKASMDSSPSDQEARQRWDIISGPIITTLKELTGHDEGKPEAWQRWWNKNKKADWDKRG